MPVLNLDKLWTLVTPQARAAAKEAVEKKTGKVTVIDVVKSVCLSMLKFNII